MWRLLRFTFLFVLLTGGAALAQTVSSTMGAIDGKVTDTSSAVLPGVTVTISSPAMMGSRNTVTNPTGDFRFTAITPGDYVATFELPGFVTMKRTEIHVAAGFTASLNIQMNLAGLEEAVTVTGASPVVDTQSTKITTTFDSKTLAALPNGSNDPWAVLAETPAVKLSRIDVGGSTSGTQTGYTAYGTTGQNRPMIEGINSTEGTGAFGNYVDMSTFDEVAVNAAGNTAEMGPPGIQMVFVGKSGGNTYHGSLGANYENEKWQSYNIDAALVAAGAVGGGGLAPRDVNRLHSFRDDYANLGGYIVKDRLWWFGAYRDLESEARYTNFPVKPFLTRLKTLTGKGTYQLTQNNRFIGYYEYNTKRQPNRLDAFALGLNAIYTSADASFDQHYYPRLFKVEYNSVLSDSMFFEIRTGQFGYNWTDYNYTNAPRYEDVGNNLVSGASRTRYTNPRRNQVLGSLSYYRQGWGGNHNLKLGWEIFRQTDTTGEFVGSWNNVVHTLRNGAPLEVYLLGNPSDNTAGLWNEGLYVTDTWRVNNKLSLNLGLRYDRFQNFLSPQKHEADRFFPETVNFPAVRNTRLWNTVAPRIGITYNVTGDGKTVLKGNWGVYWSNPGTASANPNGSWQKRYVWTDVNKNMVWDPGEEGRLVSSSGGIATVSLDPNQKDQYTIDMGGWLEREVVQNLGIRGGFVLRTEHNLSATVNINQPFSAFTVPRMVRDPGPDGIVGNGDDGPLIQAWDLDAAHLGLPTQNLVTNVDGDTKFLTWEIAGTKRMSNHWSMMVAATHTTSYDQSNSFFSTNFRQNNLVLTPNDLINTVPDTGGQIKSTDYSIKLTGSIEGPWRFKFSPVYRFQAGQNFGRTFVATLNYGSVRIPAEPLETRRQPHISLLDLRIDRAIPLPRGRLSPFMDLYNIFNANPVQNTSWSSGTSWLRPINIIPPRVLRIGAKFDF